MPRIRVGLRPNRPYVLAVLCLLGLIAWLGGAHAFSGSTKAAGDAPAQRAVAAPRKVAVAARRALTVDERIAYQRRIEEVYWRHRAATQTAAQPVPSFAEAMPETALRAKVEDTLRKSAALAQYWQRPVTGAQLQAELTRMAAQTKQPDVLRELWAALDNDPFVVAECLARPVLVERELRNWYGADERLHGAQRARVAAELAAQSGQLKALSGEYVERQLVRARDAATATSKSRLGAQAAAATATPDEKVERLAPAEWQAVVEQLAETLDAAPRASTETAPRAGVAALDAKQAKAGRVAQVAATSLPAGRVSRLQESETSFYVTTLLESSADQLTVATVTWPKEPLELWLQQAGVNATTAAVTTDAPADGYTLPQLTNAPAANADDTWRPTVAPLTGRVFHTAVWTGTEMIVWGGFYNPFRYDNFIMEVAGRYNPATDSWSLSSTVNAPAWRKQHTAVWTGTEMIVWGGYTGDAGETNTGARYNPATDVWTPTATTGAPAARSRHTAVWTGSRMIVWGGNRTDLDNSSVNTGGVYNPTTNTWTATPTTNAPPARMYHTAVWTGTEMIVWGGFNGTTGAAVNSGARYNPTTNSWTPTATTGAPSARFLHSAVWTGSRVIVWGGQLGFFDTTVYNTGALYDPATNTWSPTSTTGAPAARKGQAVAWTGSQMLLWGGSNATTNTASGARYNPDTNTWQPMSTTNAAAGIVVNSAVWTGSEWIVWGGQEVTGNTEINTGARYNPANDSWTPVTMPQNGGGRNEHPAVWTGTEMIVWGSYAAQSTPTNTGARYYPATDSWLPTSMVNVPQYRYAPLAVWTGTEMVVWGGCSDSFCFNRLNTGGRYNPATDTWRATSTVGAAESRYWFTAVWTGTEMIVWGGCDAQTCGPGGNSDREGLNNGGRYNPQTDTWQTLSTTNAPASRWGHAAVWDGTEMIVWGGIWGLGTHNTGGRYNPQTDTWSPTATANAPTARRAPSAVWTGTRMIIWGGDNSELDTYFNSGGLYDPATDTWTQTGVAAAPTARVGHRAVWTGAEMIIFGGCAGANCQEGQKTGGRYNPQTNTWRATSTTSAPSPRDEFSAVWTGTEMIVFGGEPCARCEPLYATGGRYFAQAPAGANNNPPTVTLTQPAGGTVYTAPANVTFSANAADADGSITKVEFYANATLVGTDTSAPYSFNWTNVKQLGDYQLQAVATDNLGATVGSNTVTVRINSGTTVRLTSPADGTTVNQYQNVTLVAAATPGSYTSVERVDFYDGPTLLGFDTTAPYTLDWQPYAVGARTLTARALDAAGDTVVSAPVTLNVYAPSQIISGRVTDAAGNGIAGVTIVIGGGALAPATTDANGFYSTAVSGPASFSVAPSKAGHHFAPAAVYVEQTEGDRTINFQGAATSVLISEFRLRGPNGAQDEFVELYNNADVPLTVQASDSSTGWALLGAGDGLRRGVIMNDTVIPARGHLLLTGSAYSLTGAYTSAQGQPNDANLMTDLPDDTGLALFNSNTESSWTLANRLDAVGFNNASGTTATMYREGAGLAVTGAAAEQYSFVRKQTSGTPQDTGDNAADFVLVSTTGAAGGATTQLGSPAPEGLNSPVQRNATVKVSLLDPQQPSTSAPNRVRDAAANSCGGSNCALGTLTIRRRFTNKTGAMVTTLRFRIIDITTLNTPATGTQADLRALDSIDVMVTTSSGNVLVKGTSVGAPVQSLGGGLNSAYVVNLPGGALAPNASVNVQFVLGVQTGGSFRFLVNVEAGSSAPTSGPQKVTETSMSK